MKLSDFDYQLPKELIAQQPVEPRDHSRLLVVAKDQVQDQHFYNLTDHLSRGDVLVINDSKVFPARLKGKRKTTGGQIEIFLLQEQGAGLWQCLVGHARSQAGLIVEFGYKLEGVLQEQKGQTWLIQFNKQGLELEHLINLLGETPLPPYIKVGDSQQIKQRYQTVYAQQRGSVAAPTAGLHFTDELLDKLKEDGVEIVRVTLHVGLGTFAPVKTENILQHQMHSEFYQISEQSWRQIQRAKANGQRIIAVGTTSVRVLETVFKNKQLSGWTDIFIYPGYHFQIVDGLITNFHLPKSTLLMLVAAFGQDKYGVEGIAWLMQIYQRAIAQGYRFYSFGDALFVIQ